MSLSDEELLFDTNQYVRMYGAVDDSNITSSGTFISSGSFEYQRTIITLPIPWLIQQLFKQPSVAYSVDIDDGATTDALNRCNKLLHKYKTCLKVIGWHSFTENPSFILKLCRAVLISAIFLLILITLGAQAMSCFRRDLFHWINATDNDLCGEHSDINEMIRCDISFVSTFVIPAILILVTYIYGIYLFWERNEHLENLAGQVFIKRNDLGHSVNSVVRKIIFYFLLGLSYIVISLIIRIFHAIVFKMFNSDVAICWKNFGHLITGVEKYILLIVSLIGFVFFDGVFAAAVVNYAIQSELNIFLLHAICIKVKNKMYRYMDVAIKDIDMANNNVAVLNGKNATAVALVLFIFGSRAIQGIITLGDALQEDAKSVAVITFSTLLWSFLGMFPFIQATRVTSACTDLLNISSLIRAKPLPYERDHQLDLDSLCIFTSSLINMRAEIFGVPVFPWTTYLIGTSFAFVMLFLCQYGIYHYAKWL